MEQLPVCAATADEPIEDLRGRPWDGPDMKAVMPIDQMLDILHQAPDAGTYVKLWLGMVKSFGGWVSLTITRDGQEQLGIGLPCDAQLRHRNRWHHFLSNDLDADPERRELLIMRLIEEGRYADNRPSEPRAVTGAVRNYLRAGGRILIEPDGTLSEGGGLPLAFTHGSDEAAAECIRATRAYYAVRRRWRSEQQIKRAVQMLGSRTSHGWQVLEARQ